MWATDEVYYQTQAVIAGRERTVGVVRDLTKLRGDSFGPYPDREALLLAISQSFVVPDPDHIFIVAANDGQLMEAWRRLSHPDAERAHALLENLLVGERDPQSDGITFFNLSAVPGAEILDLVLREVLAHEGWKASYEEAEEVGLFGEDCPIRRNYETLGQPLF